MKIPGLNIGHSALAALLDDGLVAAAVPEERLGRIKNAGGIFMNVTADQRVRASPGVEGLFIVPSASVAEKT